MRGCLDKRGLDKSMGVGSEAIDGALDSQRSPVEDMGVDHGGPHVAVSQQDLDGSDVRAVLQEVGRERVSEGVGGDAFRDLCLGGGPAHGALDAGLVEVMTAADAASRIGREPRRREDPLPSPLAAGPGELAFEGVGQPDAPSGVAGSTPVPSARRRSGQRNALIAFQLRSCHFGPSRVCAESVLNSNPFSSPVLHAWQPLKVARSIAGPGGPRATP